jgi:uncharacterized protein YcfL
MLKRVFIVFVIALNITGCSSSKTTITVQSKQATYPYSIVSLQTKEVSLNNLKISKDKDGLTFHFKLKNLMAESLSMNQTEAAIAVLVTDSGSFQVYLPKKTVNPNEEITADINFLKAKGNPVGLSIEGLHRSDKSGIPKPHDKSFSLRIPLKRL